MATPLLTSLRLAMSMSIIGVLSAEIANSQGGLGFRLMRYADQFKIDYVYADAILIFVLAAIINAALGALQGLQRSHGRKKAADLAAAKSALAATSGA
jgi:ABC-type nitrate/sulfonate/bicarbonate transport system permease component